MDFDLPFIVNLITLVGAIFLVWWRKPRGAPLAVLYVVIAGTGFHFVADLFFDLGEHGEHMLMHFVALGAILAAALVE